MLRVGSQFFVLFGFWLGLSGHVDISSTEDQYLIGCGLLSCALVTYIVQREHILDEEGHLVHLLRRLAGYVPWLLWEIVKANIDVAARVWSPTLRIEPQLVRVPCELKTDLGTVIYANSITLTPGTVTVSVDMETKELLVHALSAQAAQSLTDGGMHTRVKKLEGLS